MLGEEGRRDSIKVPDESRVAEYYEYRQQLDQMTADFREVITHPTYSLRFLQTGRLVKVKHDALAFGWGVIVGLQKRVPPKVCVPDSLLLHAASFRSCDRTSR